MLNQPLLGKLGRAHAYAPKGCCKRHRSVQIYELYVGIFTSSKRPLVYARNKCELTVLGKGLQSIFFLCVLVQLLFVRV